MEPQSSGALRAPDELGPRYRGRFGFSFNHKRQVRVSRNLAILLSFLRALQVQIRPFFNHNTPTPSPKSLALQ